MDKNLVEDREERAASPEGSGAQGVESAELASQLEAREDELKAAQERLIRLAAELENFKKRIEREKADHMKFALESFTCELLPFLDNLERAMAAARETHDIERLLEGLEHTLSGYYRTLEQFGLRAFCAQGKCFDPAFHEALSVEEVPGVEENTVVKELLKGYTLHDRVVRPALVVVSKKPSEGSGQGETNA